MDNHVQTVLMVEDSCKSLSSLVRAEIDAQHSASKPNKASRDDPRAQSIVRISQEVMDLIDSTSNYDLPPQTLDRVIRECLIDAYRLPSIVNNYQNETFAFYNWWRQHIKDWIRRRPSNNDHSIDYHRLGWSHLVEMMREIRDFLRPPPLVVRVIGAGSGIVNGEYKLARECLLSEPQAEMQQQQQQQQQPQSFFQYYSTTKITYEKLTADGRTISLCFCDVDRSPTSTTQNLGHSLWFLTELDEEQPNTDCDSDYYCALPRSGKRSRTNLVPPRNGWKRCSHGSFPPPTLVPVGTTAVSENEVSPDTHEQRLARWILEEDIMVYGWCQQKPPHDMIDAGMHSVLELLIDFYEEDGENPIQKTSSLGTELIVKFASICLRGSR